MEWNGSQSTWRTGEKVYSGHGDEDHDDTDGIAIMTSPKQSTPL